MSICRTSKKRSTDSVGDNVKTELRSYSEAMRIEKVSKVLLELDEKPKLEANGIEQGSVKNPRPVKVSVSDSNVVLQILRKSKDLHNSDQYKLVFTSPNRTPKQRVEHRELVK